MPSARHPARSIPEGVVVLGYACTSELASWPAVPFVDDVARPSATEAMEVIAEPQPVQEGSLALPQSSLALRCCWTLPTPALELP